MFRRVELTRKYLLIPVCIILGFILFPLIYSFFRVYPVFDDYWYADIVLKEGFGGAQLWWRLHSTGRFTSTAIISALALSVKTLYLYRLVLFTQFVLFNTSIFLLFSVFLRKINQYSIINNTLLYLIFIFFFYSTLPGLSEFVFWLTGAAIYSFGITLLNLLVIYLFFKKSKKGYSYYITILILGILICGTSELAAICALASFAVYLILNFFLKERYLSSFLMIFKSPYFIVFCCLILSFYFLVLSAPGNEERFQSEKALNIHAGEFVFALKYGFIGFLKFFYNILFIKRGVIAFGLTFLYFVSTSNKYENLNYKQFFLKYLFIQSVLFIMTFFIFLFYPFSTGVTVLIPRVLSVILFLWTTNFIFSGVTLALLINSTIRYSIQKKSVVIVLITLLLIASIPRTGNNILNAYSDIKIGHVECYEKYFKTQYLLFKTCDISKIKQGNLLCKPYMYVWDLSEDNFDSRYFLYYQHVLCKR